MTPEDLAATARGAVVAAAGCGKTDLIAKSVAVASGRQLVLTHTNAGVDALRRRLRRCGVSDERVAVDTIAGWSLKYMVGYPERCGGLPVAEDGDTDWDAVYPAMATLVRTPLIEKVVKASYNGVFVDEYQDCIEPQHELISRIAEILPVRIFGDPLQAVFRFAGEPPPWTGRVEEMFPRVATLTTPWRWNRPGEDQELGAWLIDARNSLEAQRPLSLDGAPLRWVKTPSLHVWRELAQAECFAVARRGGTAAAITKWPSGYLGVGQLTGGAFQCVEPISAKDARICLSALETSSPRERSEILVDHLRQAATGTDEPLALVKAFRRGNVSSGEADPMTMSAARLLDAIDDGAGPAVAADALDTLAQISGVRIYRRELLWATLDSLRDADAGGFIDLLPALRKRRNMASHLGRRLSKRTSGSTLLLKGMEFDHAVVIHTGDFTLNDFYVAITRGSKSLTVLSPTPIIGPAQLRTR